MAKSMLAIISASILALAACTETGSAVSNTVEAETAENKPRAERKVAARKGDGKLICKQNKRTGSRLGGAEVCYTQEEWDRKAELAREDHRRTTTNSVSSGN